VQVRNIVIWGGRTSRQQLLSPETDGASCEVSSIKPFRFTVGKVLIWTTRPVDLAENYDRARGLGSCIYVFVRETIETKGRNGSLNLSRTTIFPEVNLFFGLNSTPISSFEPDGLFPCEPALEAGH
jgi:hypothetical protein